MQPNSDNLSNEVADNKIDFESESNISKLTLTKIQQTSSDEIFELTSSEGSVFFIRTSYLQIIDIENIQNKIISSQFLGFTFSEEESEDILCAGFAFSAEKKAQDYLARCEQCRFKLTQKLLQKGFSKKSIELALNRLEEKNYLSDSRYSSCWIRSHCISKFQGKTRLLSELLSRGISKNIATETIENFFSEITEEDMCEKAYQKAIRQKKSGEKLLKYLLDSGFPYKMVNFVIKRHKTDD